MQADRTYHILVIAPDPSLAGEIQEVLDDLKDYRCVLTFEGNELRGIEAARDRQPDLIVLHVESDVVTARHIASELATAARDAVVVGAYRPEALGEENVGSMVIELMRENVRDFLRRPISNAEVEQIFRRHLVERAVKRGQVGKVVSFVSNKGGVGKSTTSISAAVCLAERNPDEVLLIDGSIQMGVAASMLDLEPEATLAHAAREAGRLDETLLRSFSTPHSSGLRILAAPHDAMEATIIDEAAISRILSVSRQTFKYVIVDTFPMVDSFSVAVLDLSNMVFVVLSSMVPMIEGGAAFLGVLDQIGVPQGKQRLVVNEHHPGFTGKLKPSDVANQIGRNIDFVVPFRRQVLVAMNTGRPYIQRAPKWYGFGKSILGMVKEIEGTGGRAPAELTRTAREALSSGQASTQAKPASTEVHDDDLRGGAKLLGQ
ncbi:MAG: AAA family ATPase [Planctomycetota bacterium]